MLLDIPTMVDEGVLQHETLPAKKNSRSPPKNLQAGKDLETSNKPDEPNLIQLDSAFHVRQGEEGGGLYERRHSSCVHTILHGQRGAQTWSCTCGPGRRSSEPGVNIATAYGARIKASQLHPLKATPLFRYTTCETSLFCRHTLLFLKASTLTKLRKERSSEANEESMTGSAGRLGIHTHVPIGGMSHATPLSRLCST